MEKNHRHGQVRRGTSEVANQADSCDLLAVRKLGSSRILLFAFGLGVGGCLLYLTATSNRQKHIQSLSMNAYAGDFNATAALRDLGSNAVPGLVAQAQYRVNPALKVLYQQATKLPRPIGKIVGPIIGLPDDVRIREAAARAFGSLDYEAEEAIPILIHLLGDPEGNVRWEAAKSLSQIGAIAVPPLIDILQERTNALRGIVCYTLGQMGTNAQMAATALLPGLTDPDEPVRNQTAYALSQLGIQAVVALVNLSARGNAPEAAAANAVLRRMTTSPHPPIIALRELAADLAATNRVQALEALGNLRPATALSIGLLTTGLQDADGAARAMAARGLGHIGPKAAMALPELSRLGNDPEDAVRAAAAEASNNINRADKNNPASSPP